MKMIKLLAGLLFVGNPIETSFQQELERRWQSFEILILMLYQIENMLCGDIYLEVCM